MPDPKERAVPAGRLGRIARMAALGARTGASLVLSRGPEEAAARAAEVLGTMRGLAAKIGQMASYVDGFVPEPQQEAFEQALRSLRSQAMTSPADAVQRVIEEDLGAPLDRLFATFERVPFASASIGQVHRATLEDGQEVAVKVQHPGVDRAVLADLDNAGMIEPLLRAMGAGKLGSAGILAEVRARFAEELDYRHEAEQQRFFFRNLAGRDGCVIPAILEERSSRRVLTSELARGLSLEEAAARPEEERAAWIRALWSFTFGAILVHRRFNADPHPGNFLFQEGGRVVFLDFGCVQPIGPEQNAAARRMHRAAIERDEGAFASAVAAMLKTRGGDHERLLTAYTRRCFEPLFSSPFRFTRGYVAGVVQGIQEMKRAMLLGSDGSQTPLPPTIALMNRLQFGFYSVLARLDAEVDYAALERPLLRAPGEEAGVDA